MSENYLYATSVQCTLTYLMTFVNRSRDNLMHTLVFEACLTQWV